MKTKKEKREAAKRKAVKVMVAKLTKAFDALEKKIAKVEAWGDTMRRANQIWEKQAKTLKRQKQRPIIEVLEDIQRSLEAAERKAKR